MELSRMPNQQLYLEMKALLQKAYQDSYTAKGTPTVNLEDITGIIRPQRSSFLPGLK